MTKVPVLHRRHFKRILELGVLGYVLAGAAYVVVSDYCNGSFESLVDSPLKERRIEHVMFRSVDLAMWPLLFTMDVQHGVGVFGTMKCPSPKTH